MKKEVKKSEKCVLYDRDCIGCGECEFCDLDPLKICDNCGKCLHTDDYASFKIDSIDGVALPEKHGGGCDCGYGDGFEHDDCCGDYDEHDDCCDNDECGSGHIHVHSRDLHGHKN